MKAFAFLVMSMLLSSNSIAQNTKQFSGVVLDKGTGAPIAWAHIAGKDRGVGTVSNTEGRFSINVPMNGASTIVDISCVGYKSRSIILRSDGSSDLKIILEPDIRLLNEVVIKPPDIRQLILDAINKIPVNYPAVPTIITGFYRESERFDSVNYIYISEGILEARKESYQETHRGGQIRLTKARKKEFYDSLNKIRFYAGPHIIHRFDFVMRRMEFINKNKLKDYTYSIDDITLLNGKEIYKISFKPNTTDGLFQGVFFLEINSGAFVSANYSLTQTGLKYYEKILSPNFDWLNREYLINYMQVKNKWIVQNVWQQGIAYDGILKDTIIYATEFVTTETDTLNTSSFLYGDRLQYKDVFVYKANNLDPIFWKDYNILKENSFIQRLQDKELNAKSISTDYSPIKAYPPISRKNGRSSIVNFITRFSFDIALTTVFPSYLASNVSLTGSGINISSSITEAKPIIFGLYYSYSMRLRKGFSLGLSFTNFPGKLSFDNIYLGLGYEYITTIRTRPLKFTGGLGISSNSLYLPIGDAEGPLTINGKELSGKIEVNVQKKYFALQPSIKVSLELNRRLDFFVGANLLLDFGIQDKILLEEQHGSFFSRKNSSLKTNDPSIDFRVNDIKTEIVPISINSLFLTSGVTFKYSR